MLVKCLDVLLKCAWDQKRMEAFTVITANEPSSDFEQMRGTPSLPFLPMLRCRTREHNGGVPQTFFFFGALTATLSLRVDSPGQHKGNLRSGEATEAVMYCGSLLMRHER